MSKTGVLPRLDKLPLLPQNYLDGLPASATVAVRGEATESEVVEFAQRYDNGPQPELVLSVIGKTIQAKDSESTRNATRDALCWAAREAKGRRYGWDNAVEHIRTAAEQAYEARGKQLDEDEFQRLVTYAVGQVRDIDEDQLYQRWQSTAPQPTASQTTGSAGSLWPEPANPRQVALQTIATAEGSGAPLRYWKTLWFRWSGTHYQRLAVEDVRDHLYDMLADALYTDARGNSQPWKPTENKLNQVIDAMRGLTKVPADAQPPCWIDDRPNDSGTVIPCANGLLRLSDRTLMTFNASYFNLFAVPYRFDSEADYPRWRRFLTEVFGDDVESIQLLQDWFYYVLTGRTDLHKMLLWVGPKRGGKGTVARILKALIGADAYVGLSAETVGRQFGLQGAIHKSLGVFPDEDQVDRTSGKRLVAFVKTVTGEDDVAVDIKNKDPWNGRLPIRFMYHSNQMPVLPDPSGAVFSRLLVIQTMSTFLGKEDPKLEDALTQELPGILNWALDAQLAQRGRFVQPSSSADLLGEVDSYSNPVREFLMERTKFGPHEEVPAKRLYTEFDTWRHANGLTSHGDSRWFGRSLRAAMLDLAPESFSRKQHDNEPSRPWYYHGLGLLPVDNDESGRVLRAVPPPPADTGREEQSGT